MKELLDHIASLPGIETSTQMLDTDVGIFAMHSVVDPIELEVDKKHILFLFPEGNCGFNFKSSLSNKNVEVTESQYVMSVFPMKDWTLTLGNTSGSVQGIALSLEKLHVLLNIPTFNDPENLKEAVKRFRVRDAYELRDYPAHVKVGIHQLFQVGDTGFAQNIFKLGKVLEFLSYYMNPTITQTSDPYECPYIKNNNDLNKIREAEAIIQKAFQTPPTIKELARQVGTNELKLKSGFKHVYGKTIYNYITDYRMDTARLLLEKKSKQVKEVAGYVGYTNPSHFIVAFRKKFGVTPKKYLMSL